MDPTYSNLQSVPSNKLLNPTSQDFQIDQYLHQKQQQDQSFKNQQQLSTNKNNQLKLSSSKGSSKKQSTPASHHQRTKSDNIYNRGSLTGALPTNQHAQILAQQQQIDPKALGSAQQQKRGIGNAAMKNNFIDAQSLDTQNLPKPGHMKHASLGSGFVIQSMDQNQPNPPITSTTRKAPNSAHAPKKQSQQYLANQQSLNKKSTKEKYIELKVLYNDLLERHYALASSQQNQQSYNQILQKGAQPSQQSNQNLINFYPGPSQLPLSDNLGQLSNKNAHKLESNTPRILMNNKISAQNLNNNNQYIVFQNDHEGEFAANHQPVSKTIKHTSNKLDQHQVDGQTQLKSAQQKASLKQQLQSAQGQSRKAGGNHKRSVSDGNEHLFKFKQAAMQRYLYPQPSNQTINAGQVYSMQQQFIEEGQQKKNLVSLQQQQHSAPSHQRRVSDDYQQKIKKQQIHLQQQISGPATMKQPMSHTAQKSSNNFLLENVPMEPPENHQHPPSVDFNIKGFLIEMRNKQGNIQVIDGEDNEQNNDMLIEQARQKQFAMIIEENSPGNTKEYGKLNQQNSNITLESSRKLFNVDSSSGLALQGKGKNQVQATKPVIEFNKVHQKYKHLQLQQQDNLDGDFQYKRMQSPSFEQFNKLDDEDPRNIIPNKQGIHHKRVKSDIPESNQHSKKGPVSGPPSSNGNGLRLNKKASQQTSNSNLLYSDKTTPRKAKQISLINQPVLTKTKQIELKPTSFPSQIQQQTQYMGGVDGSNSKKVINVSIDLIKDADLDQSAIDDIQHQIDGGHWIVVDKSASNLNIQEILNEKNKQNQPKSKMQQKLVEGVKSQGMSGSSNEGIRQEKYKKMRQKYQKQITNESGNDQVIQDKQRIQMTENYDKQASQPLVGLSNNQQIYSQNSPVTLSKKKDQFKFNQIQETAQTKKGATQIQQNMIIKQGVGVNLNPGTPKQSEKVFKKKDIKPSQKINSTPVQQNKKNTPNTSLTLQQQQQIQFQQQQQVNQQAYSQQINQPQKKITTAPANSIVQTQESARNTQPTQQQQQLIIQSDIRVDTQDSTASDPGLSPRQRMINKLTKYVKLTFRQTGLPPSTTVDFYRIGKVLGKGAFGKVNLALHKLTQKFAAIKSINKQYLSEDTQTKKVMQEVVILKRTRHRNIVRLYEFFETQKHILFVIELCAGGDLLNYVRKRRRLKEDAAKYIFKQLIEGLGYCHMKGILHRDIKLDNILLDSEGEVKICDFGVSKIVKKGEKMTEQCGTPAYIAPEILRDRGYEGFAVDIWSAGVVLYAMLYGTVPFKANNMSELQKLIVKAKYTLKDDGVSEEARELITACLEKDPIKRITVNEILSHKWLVDVDESLQLFTEQEKEYIKSEFTYNDADRYNRNECVDPFTEHLLDSTQNSMLKNCTSKSVILAPFNSTKSNLDEEEETKGLTDSVQELMQSKGCIKFAGRVRDIDKQYELNNNKDLDNGVYHKVEEDEPEAKDPKAKIEGDSDDSLQSSFNKETSIRSDDDEETIRIREQAQQKKEERKKKKKKEKQTELEKLESLIHQEEEDQCERNEIKIEDCAESKVETHPYGQVEQMQQKQVNRDPKKSPRPELNEHNTEMNVLQSAQTLIIDEKIVSQIELFGYPKEYIVKSLNNNELNYALTAYYLLLNEHTFSINDKFGGLDAVNNFNQMMSQSVSKTLL